MTHGKRLKRTREWRPEISVDPAVIAYVGARQSPWHETAEDAARAEARQRERALLLRWVRREMNRRLTLRERRMVEQYYFQAMTMQRVAHKNKTHIATVSRSLRRAVHKLRAAAREAAGAEPPRDAALKAMRGGE